MQQEEKFQFNLRGEINARRMFSLHFDPMVVKVVGTINCNRQLLPTKIQHLWLKRDDVDNQHNIYSHLIATSSLPVCMHRWRSIFLLYDYTFTSSSILDIKILGESNKIKFKSSKQNRIYAKIPPRCTAFELYSFRGL